MYKRNTKYKLVGYQPVGVDYNVPRTEIAECKNGYWYPYGSGKMIVNFVIEEVVELKSIQQIREEKLNQLGI